MRADELSRQMLSDLNFRLSCKTGQFNAFGHDSYVACLLEIIAEQLKFLEEHLEQVARETGVFP